MADVKVFNHEYHDTLWNKERKICGESARLVSDGKVVVEVEVSTDAARSCPDSSRCYFKKNAKPGREPCNKCRRLVLGDYYAPRTF